MLDHFSNDALIILNLAIFHALEGINQLCHPEYNLGIFIDNSSAEVVIC